MRQFSKIIAFYFENYAQFINTLCAQNGQLLNVKVHGTYGHRCALEGHLTMNSVHC
jgi:predicted restriction endonuclease